MHHVIIAAMGGFLFILGGIARQMERAHMLRTGKTESAWVWASLLIIGILLMAFAFGVIIFHLDHHH